MNALHPNGMNTALRGYVVKETIISIVINSAISAFFVWLVFGGAKEVPLWGSGGLAVDFLPQTFMISLMSVLVPSALTRKRRRARLIAVGPSTLTWLPRNLFLRAILLAALSTMIFSAIGTAVLSVLADGPIRIGTVWPLKIAYGALIGAIVTPIAVRVTLGEKDNG